MTAYIEGFSYIRTQLFEVNTYKLKQFAMFNENALIKYNFIDFGLGIKFKISFTNIFIW